MSKTYIQQDIGASKFGYQNKNQEHLERGFCKYDISVNAALTIQESMKVQGLVNQFTKDLDVLLGFES